MMGQWMDRAEDYEIRDRVVTWVARSERQDAELEEAEAALEAAIGDLLEACAALRKHDTPVTREKLDASGLRARAHRDMVRRLRRAIRERDAVIWLRGVVGLRGIDASDSVELPLYIAADLLAVINGCEAPTDG